MGQLSDAAAPKRAASKTRAPCRRSAGRRSNSRRAARPVIGAWRAASAGARQSSARRRSTILIRHAVHFAASRNRQDALRLVRPVVQARRKRDW